MIEPERRAALQAARLAALAQDSGVSSPGPGERMTYAPGAALLEPRAEAGGATAWVYPFASDVRSLGEAIVWARHHGLSGLHVVVDDERQQVCGHLARRARLFDTPKIRVWRVSAVPGRARAATVVPVESETHPGRRQPAAAGPLVDMLLDAGVEVVVEDGLVRGEVNGLEVARISHGTTSLGAPLTEPALEVGVGAADRELTGYLHGDLPSQDKLNRAVEVVRRHRSAGAAPHPLNQLVPERWLRARAVREPDMVGLVEVRPVEAWPPRANLKDPGVALAEGVTDGGQRVVLAFSVGIDVDLVPTAADARAELMPDEDLWLVVPERDDTSILRSAAEGLHDPAVLVPVEGDWRA